MNAKEFAQIHGQDFIGKQILTQAIGSYPGGWATLIELTPDPEAPEIVMQVNHPTFGEIGIFEHEDVRI